MAMNMPPDVEARIRALPGNQTCADCSNLKPQWASVTYGSLVCLECSGSHRSLGVHLSFVRSVQMDAWKPEEIKRMELSGGNTALVDFFSSRGIDKAWPVAAKYNTKQAAYFKERLSRRVEGKTEPPPDPGRYDPVSGGDAMGAEPLPNETPDEYNARQARLRERARERMREKFGDKGMGGLGSEPLPSNDGLDLGGAIGGVGRFVGGALGGVGNFLRSSVIENEGLHSTIRGTVGAVGETAGGAWSSIRRSIGENEGGVGGIVGGLKHHTLDDSGALRQGLGWTAGAVGGMLEKASHGIGDFMADDSSGQASPGVPTCSKGHRLRTEPRSDLKCLSCNARGTRYVCSQGCDYNICTKCFEKPGASPQQKGGMNFEDDDWGDGWDAPQKAAPPEPTHADMNKLAKDLGMKLSADKPPSASPGGQQRPRSETAPAAASPAAASPARPSPEASPERRASAAASPAAAGGGATPSKPQPKKKGLDESDDFFSEFGL